MVGEASLILETYKKTCTPLVATKYNEKLNICLEKKLGVAGDICEMHFSLQKKNCHKLSLSFLQNHPEISMRKRCWYPFVARYRRRPATNQPNSSRTATAAAGASSNVEEGETRPRLAKYVNLVDLLEWTDHPVLFYWVSSKYSIVELVLGVTDYRLTQNEGLPERRSLKKH